MAKKPKIPELPAIVPGEWQAELLGGGSLHLGGATNQTPTPHAIEFSFVTLPALATGPAQIGLPAVVFLMCPAEPIVNDRPGLFMQNGLVTIIDLSVTRALFSDLLPRPERAQAKSMAFKAEAGPEGRLPISSWGLTFSLPDE